MGCENNAKEDNGLRDDGQVQDPALDHYRLAVGTQKEKIPKTFFVQGFPLTNGIGPILFSTGLCKVLRMYGV